MVQNWEPGTQYNNGDVVRYEGHNYKIIQPHRSQGDWTPPVTPALWGRMQDGDGGHGGNEHGHQSYEQKPPQQQQGNYGTDQNTGGKNWDQHTTQTVDVHEHEKQKNWYDIPEDRRKQLEIGGGLALGAALLGGGYAAYKHHENGEEDKKAEAWGLQNYLQEAEARAAQFRQRGPQGPVTWVLTEGKNIPQGSIVGGTEHDAELWVARAYYDGGIHPGKAFRNSRRGAVISYGGKEVEVDKYEVLIGNQQAVRWVQQHGRLNVNSLGGQPVEGGRDKDGSILYIAQAPYKGGVHPGKISEKLSGACIAYGDDEKLVDTYNVLVYV